MKFLPTRTRKTTVGISLVRALDLPVGSVSLPAIPGLDARILRSVHVVIDAPQASKTQSRIPKLDTTTQKMVVLRDTADANEPKAPVQQKSRARGSHIPVLKGGTREKDRKVNQGTRGPA